MDVKEILTIIGWIVAFAFAVLSGGVIIPLLTKKTKLIVWDITSETELIPKDLSKSLGIPVVLHVGTETSESLTLLHAGIGNNGNEVIQDIEVKFSTNPKSNILNIKLVEDLGEYSKHINWNFDQNNCELKLKFINPKTKIDLEILVDGYDSGSANFDLASPGVEIKQIDLTQWSIPTSLLKGLALSVMGIHYDPSVSSLNKISDELKAIRKFLQEKK